MDTWSLLKRYFVLLLLGDTDDNDSGAHHPTQGFRGPDIRGGPALRHIQRELIRVPVSRGGRSGGLVGLGGICRRHVG